MISQTVIDRRKLFAFILAIVLYECYYLLLSLIVFCGWWNEPRRLRQQQQRA